MTLDSQSNSHVERVTLRKSYAPPQLQKLTVEQASLRLVPYAWDGDQNARELLGLLFPMQKGDG